MAVATAATPDWMAMLRAKKKDRKDEAAPAPRDEPAKASPSWVRAGDASKPPGRGSPLSNSRRAHNGAAASPPTAKLGEKKSVSMVRNDGAESRGNSRQSATLPRSFGRAETSPPVAGSGAIVKSASRATDDSGIGKTQNGTLIQSTSGSVKTTTITSSSSTRSSGGPVTKPNVSKLRDLFSQGKRDTSSSPNISGGDTRPRSSATTGQTPTWVSKTPPSSLAMTQSGKSPSTSAQAQHLDSPSEAAAKLRRISEERSGAEARQLAASAGDTSQKLRSNQPMPSTPKRGLDKTVAGLPRQKNAMPAPSADNTDESLQVTNIDDFIMEKRSYSMSDAEAIKQGTVSEPTTPSRGSPLKRRRSNSILMTPERKVSQPNMRRRVSFSEIRLETVHQFQREEVHHSDESDDDDETDGVVLKRVTVLDDPDGPTTQLHRLLSPHGGAKPSRKAWTPSTPQPPADEEDDTMNVYADVSDDVAALLW